jgi:hypothetical protein
MTLVEETQGRAWYRRGGLVALVAIGLYVANLAVNLSLVSAISADGTLSGEETSESFRNVVLLPARLQNDPMATAFGAHVYFYLASYALPHIDLFYGRIASAIGNATTAPLVFLIARALGGFALPVAGLVGLLAALVPGILNFGWMATPYGLECPFGLLAVWLASRPGRWAALLAGISSAFAATIFAPGLCFLPVVLYLVYRRQWAARASKKAWAVMVLVPLLAGLVIVAPALWWTNSNQILLGGGSLSSSSGAWSNVRQMLGECVTKGGSYYYYSTHPALSSPLVWGSAVLGLIVCLWQRKGLWLWLGLAGAVAIYVASGQMIGMRRGVPAVAFVLLLAGMFWNALYRRDRWYRVAAATVLAATALVWAGWQAYDTRAHYSAGTWAVRRDFKFAPAAGKTMAQTYALILEDTQYLLRHGQGFEPERTLAVLHMLADRNGLESRKTYTREAVVRMVLARQAARRAKQRNAP